jgi:Tfp pilus assembly protein PilF
LLVIILSAVAIQHKTNSSKGELKQAQTVEQELNSMVQNIKNNAPADNASTAEKTAYYDKLVVAYGKSENYKAAIAAFETREAISADGITYLDYIIAAKYYQRVGDHTKASQALDNAVKVAPKDGDPEAGYTYQTVINRIAEARTELGL